VLWPLVVGWFGAALVFRIYGDSPAAWRRILASWVVGLAIALMLRALITGRPTTLLFAIVLFAFTAATLLGVAIGGEAHTYQVGRRGDESAFVIPGLPEAQQKSPPSCQVCIPRPDL
jgi:predicted membrane protein